MNYWFIFMDINNWTQIHTHILQLEQEGLVTRTFQRLKPRRQAAVLGAILDEATEKGPNALNIKQVAQRAGVSVGSLYQYFNNRDGLLAFTVALCVRFVTDSFNSFRPFLSQLSLREALTAYLLGGVEWSAMQIGMVRFFARAAYHNDSHLSETVVRPIANTMREMVGEILAQGAACGEIRTDVDVEAATRIIHALMITVGDSQLLPYLNIYFQLTSESVSEEQIVNSLIDFILHGIADIS